MNKTELKKIVREMKKQQLAEAFISAYSELTPEKKKKIDSLMNCDIPQPSQRVPKGKSVSMEQLKAQIDRFVENAENGLYYSPNRTVPKKKRSNWRFEAKSYWEGLFTIDGQSDDYTDAQKYLLKMYDILARGTGIYIFRSTDTFHAVFGKYQEDILPALLDEISKRGIGDFEIDAFIHMACETSTDNNSYYENMIDLVISRFSEEEETLDRAIEICLPKYEKAAKIYEAHPISFYITAEDIDAHRNGERLTEMMASLYLAKGKKDSGYSIFMSSPCYKNNREIGLYVLLRRISKYGDDQDWTELYEKGVKDGLEPRKDLREEYAEKKGIPFSEDM